MSFRTRDALYGPNCYAPVKKWEEDSYIQNAFQAVSTTINDLFEHIYFEFKCLDSTGNTTITYEDCGLDDDYIYDAFYQLYQERLVAFPYYIFGGDGQTLSGNRIRAAVKTVLDLNYWKYKKMVQTLGLVYDPIENYNMTESGSDTDTPSGTSTKEHTVNATKIGSIKVSGVVDPTITRDSETGQLDIDVEFIDNAGKHTTVVGGTDTQAGKKLETTDNEDGSITTAAVNGENVQTKNYTTTMDSASTGRLHNYTDELGTTAQMLSTDTREQIPITGEVTAGNPNLASYTDTESFDDRVDTKEHELSRSGNIGVTTSQQMIEQERKLVEFSVVKEFFKDLEHALFLSVWY